MTEAELRAEIKAGACGVYLLAGEEEYLKRYYLSEIRKSVLVEESLAGFNHTKVSYLDGGFGTLADSVSQSPFMQEKRLCELSGFNFNSAKENLLSQLRSIIDDATDNEECVFVIYAECDMYDTAKNSKAQKKVAAALGQDVKTVIFEKTTPQKLVNWMKRHFAHEGIKISEGDCMFMIERCGRSMEMLASEIDKVCAYKHAHGLDTAGREDIVYLCPRNEEIGAFALANALLDSNSAEIFRILGEYKKSGSELKPKAILASVCSIYMSLCTIKELCEQGADEQTIAKRLRMHEYKAKLYAKTARAIPAQKLERAIELCVAADTDMKLTSSDVIALERLLCSIATECRR